MKNSSTKQWSLHFDGKRPNEKEHQIVVFTNKNEKMKKDGTAKLLVRGSTQFWMSTIYVGL